MPNSRKCRYWQKLLARMIISTMAIFAMASQNGSMYQGHLTLLSAAGVWEEIQMPEPGTYRTADFSAVDGWAFGRHHIAHWDGTIWTQYPLPAGYEGDVVGVKSLSTDDVWAVGCRSIFHWDGHQWQSVPLELFPADCLFGVDFISPTQGWVVGVNDDLRLSQYPQAIVFEWDGQTWTRNSSFADSVAFLGIDVVSLTDGWLVEDMNRMLRWNGMEWKPLATPGLEGNFSSIAMVNTNDGWMAGYADNLKGVIWHWDGVAWQELQQTRLGLESIAMVSPDFGWAVGGDWGNGDSILLHWDGKAWAEYPISADAPLKFVWARSTDDGWIFAGDEDIPGYEKGGVFRYRPTVVANSQPTLAPSAETQITLEATGSTVESSPPFIPATLIPTSAPDQPDVDTTQRMTPWLVGAALLVICGGAVIALLYRRRRGL